MIMSLLSWFNPFRAWIISLFKDEHGDSSSKRLVGIGCALSLCVVLIHNAYNPTSTNPSEAVVDAVALLAFGCLGLTSIDKFTAARLSKGPKPKQTLND